MLITPERFYSIKLSVAKATQNKDYGFDMFNFPDNPDKILQSKAMKIETVYSCIRDKSETVGRLPVYLYDRDEKGNVSRVYNSRLFRILTQQPCSFMTMQGFMEFMTASYELYGAFYAYKVYNDRGSFMELIPFRNQQNVRPAMDVHGNIYYNYVRNDGTPDLVFGINQLFVITQFTLDGYTPMSPISYNSTLLNGTYDTEKTWKEYQSKGITSQFALITDKTINPKSQDQLKKDFKEFRGVSGLDNIPILEDGLKIQSLKLSPKDSEQLASREFSVNRICRIFRVPPERIGVNAKSASGNQTLLDIDEFYMRNAIEPIILKFENAINSILNELSVKKFIRVNRKAFYSGSPHRMVEAVTAEFKMCACTINEMRIDLGRDPVDGGDVFAIDTNNLTLGQLTDIPSLQAQLNDNKPKEEQTDET